MTLLTSFEWFIARRYFSGQRTGGKFLAMVKRMAIGGVAIGAAGLLIALSVVHGFKSVINEKVMSYGAHVSIDTFGTYYINRTDTLLPFLLSKPQILQAQTVLEGQGMIQRGDAVQGAIFRGYEAYDSVTALPSFIVAGQYQLSSPKTGIPSIILGKTMAKSLNADIGDCVFLYSFIGSGGGFENPSIRGFKIEGIFETGIDRFDDAVALVHADVLREMNRIAPNLASQIELKLSDISLITPFGYALSEELEYPQYTQTIFERFSGIFAWVDLQEQTIPLVIGVMIIVAAFNLIGAILMMVLERSSDIGILKTLGVKDGSIRTIFILEGVLIATIGLLLGISLTLIFWYAQTTWNIIPLPQENYYMTTAPVELHILDFVWVTVLTYLLCIGASWIPARVASRLNPLSVIAFGK